VLVAKLAQHPISGSSQSPGKNLRCDRVVSLHSRRLELLFPNWSGRAAIPRIGPPRQLGRILIRLAFVFTLTFSDETIRVVTLDDCSAFDGGPSGVLVTPVAYRRGARAAAFSLGTIRIRSRFLCCLVPSGGYFIRAKRSTFRATSSASAYR